MSCPQEAQPHDDSTPTRNPAEAALDNGLPGDAGDAVDGNSSPPFQRSFRFWAIMVGLCVTSLMASLENSVVVTAGPAIVMDLKMGDSYVWVTTAFFVCCAAVQPLFGQLCDIFGRRWPMLFVTALFTLGSGICGGATSGAMLIAGRAVQGAGSGGVVMIVHIILADLVPLRSRGYYLAIILAVYGLGLTLGPFIGGAFVDSSATWRWAFYINLPTGGLALALLYFFLHVKYDRETTVIQKLKRIDWVGNGLIIAGTVAMLVALAGAGTQYSWASWRTLVPLLLGLFGLVLFAAWEVLAGSWFPGRALVMPPRLFRHRTSLVVAINTFLHWMLVYWALYFLPIYFQAVLLYSAERSGVSLLPMSLVSIPGSAAAAMVVSRWGKFRWVHLVGESIFTVGLGLFALQSPGTTVAEWATFQSIAALGGGMVLDTLLPAFQAPVPESDQAAATAAWAFIRTVGGVWGVAVPAAIFNNRVDQLADTISDASVRQVLVGGGAYQYGSASFVGSIPEPVRGQVRAVYSEALKAVFLAAVAFGGVACLLFLVEKDVELRTQLTTEYGLLESDERKASASGEEGKSSDGVKVEAATVTRR